MSSPEFLGHGPKLLRYVGQGVFHSSIFSLIAVFFFSVQNSSFDFAIPILFIMFAYSTRVFAALSSPQPIAVLRPAGLHWSAELRRQATASARERSKVESEMEAGSARCTPLPPKASTFLFVAHGRVFCVFFCLVFVCGQTQERKA